MKPRAKITTNTARAYAPEWIFSEFGSSLVRELSAAKRITIFCRGGAKSDLIYEVMRSIDSATVRQLVGDG